MFGYLKIDKKSPEKVKEYFKYSYCSLCKVLNENYGLLGRCIISYDITVLSLFLIDPHIYENFDKIHCIRGKTSTQKNALLRQLSTLNILLFKEKLLDSIKDTGKIQYKILFFLFKKIFEKAQKYDPLLAELTHSLFGEFYKNEANTRDIFSISSVFADIMMKIGCYFNLDKSSNVFLGEISKWVYFIDAVDDLEKDIENDEFNVFKKNKLDDNNISTFIEIYKRIYNPDFNRLNLKNINELTLYHLTKHSIPETTFKIFRGKLYA